jgi:hypothetical protein
VTAASSALLPGEKANTVVVVTNGALGPTSGTRAAYTRSMVSIASTALTAVTAPLAAYLGVKAANLAPERRGEDDSMQVAHLVGAVDADEAQQAIETAIDNIRRLREGYSSMRPARR